MEMSSSAGTMASARRFASTQLMEAVMRANFALSSIAGVLVNATLVSVSPAADWNNPYFYRETSGSWTNVEYNDGVCHYYYSYNAYDQNMKLNRYGDCSHVAIGPDGVAARIYTAPVVGRAVPLR